MGAGGGGGSQREGASCGTAEELEKASLNIGSKILPPLIIQGYILITLCTSFIGMVSMCMPRFWFCD